MNTPTTSWQPIASEQQAERARDIIVEIADLLRAPPANSLDGDILNDPDADPEAVAPAVKARNASLAGGHAGIALFYAYLHLAWNRGGDDDLAVDYLSQAMDVVATVPMSSGLYGGFTGVAWTAHHLRGRVFTDEDDPVEAVDELLGQFLSHPVQPGDYDLISGLAGHGAYALERLPKPMARVCLERVIQQLADMAVEVPDGTSWFSPPEELPEQQREIAPEGYYNLGVAHGVPAIIALLGAACAAGVATSQARPLLDGAVSWLLSRQLPPGSATVYPSWITLGAEKDRPSRMAWCYGDPGIAATLLVAANCVGRSDWRTAALSLACSAAATPAEKSGVIDTGLCHGAAGLCHLYNRMYQSSGNKELLAAARFWLDQTLDMRREGKGLAGYLTYRPTPGSDNKWVPDAGFLTGVSGVGLALLGCLTPVEPKWDRVLLASVPAVGADPEYS